MDTHTRVLISALKKKKKARMYCDTDENDDLVLKKNIIFKKKK